MAPDPACAPPPDRPRGAFGARTAAGRAVVVAVAVAAGCAGDGGYSPLGEVRYDEFAGPREALRAVRAAHPGARVLAIGEYHPTRRSPPARPALEVFREELLPALAPGARVLILEAWAAARCDDAAASVEAQLAGLLDRPPAQAQALGAMAAGAPPAVPLRWLGLSCLARSALRDARGRVAVGLLLELITDKLGEAARAALAEGPGAVIVYGGALHNDLAPRWSLRRLSYAAPLARERAGDVVELDLVVPEVVEGVPSLRGEPWFPLVAAAGARALLHATGPASYVLVLPRTAPRPPPGAAAVAAASPPPAR